MSQGMGGVRQAVLPLLIHGKSRMRRRARTDLCGGRSVMIVPTPTAIWLGLYQTLSGGARKRGYRQLRAS
jgi:hypothetical protein